MSVRKKPFKTGEFGAELAAHALHWLQLHSPDSEEFQACILIRIPTMVNLCSVTWSAI